MSLVTRAEPRNAPITAAAMSTPRVRPSTPAMPANRNASIQTGIVSPTVIVPGISPSFTDLLSLKAADVVAKAPIPNTSKKFATAPTTVLNGACFLPSAHFSAPSSVAFMDLIFLKTSTALSRIPIAAIALKIVVIVKTSVAIISCARFSR